MVFIAFVSSIGAIFSVVAMNYFRRKMNEPKKNKLVINESTWKIKFEYNGKEIEIEGTDPEEIERLYKLLDGSYPVS